MLWASLGMVAVVAVQRCVLRAHPHVLFPVRASVPLPVTREVGLGRLGMVRRQWGVS